MRITLLQLGKKYWLIPCSMFLGIGLALAVHAESALTQEAYDTYLKKAETKWIADIEFCEAEKNLANAKLTDYHNNDRELLPTENEHALVDKSKQKCGEYKKLDPKLSATEEITIEEAQSATPVEEVAKNEDLIASINELWAGSVLENKGELLVNECAGSGVPETCAKVIAVQTKYETNFGSAGVGASHKNLTGIRDSGVWRSYEKYDDSLKDTVKLFIDGNYEDYFTLYSLETGLYKYLDRWGTNNYTKVLTDVYQL